MTDLKERYGQEELAPDAFRQRMEAQCSRIDRYRLQVLREQHRHLSRDEAALEWIERYADGFEQGADDI